jgi:hypothetical protein
VEDAEIDDDNASGKSGFTNPSNASLNAKYKRPTGGRN